MNKVRTWLKHPSDYSGHFAWEHEAVVMIVRASVALVQFDRKQDKQWKTMEAWLQSNAERLGFVLQD